MHITDLLENRTNAIMGIILHPKDDLDNMFEELTDLQDLINKEVCKQVLDNPDSWGL